VSEKIYLSEDYKHKRVFHSIALHSVKCSFDNIIREVFRAGLSGKNEENEPIEMWLIKDEGQKKSKIELFRTGITLPFDFIKRGEFDQEKQGNNYSYYIYFIKFKVTNEKEIVIVSCPFVNMTRYLCHKLITNHDRLRGKGIQFQRLDINKVIETLAHSNDPDNTSKSQQKLEDSLKMTGILMQIFGDPRNKILGLKGENIPKSETYYEIIKSLRNVRVINFSCNFLFKLKNNRSALEVDRFGRFSFRIGGLGKNIDSIYTVFKYFYSIDAIKENSKVPYIQSLKNYWDIRNIQENKS
jgi:hypothetical protein